MSLLNQPPLPGPEHLPPPPDIRVPPQEMPPPSPPDIREPDLPGEHLPVSDGPVDAPEAPLSRPDRSESP